MKRISTVAAAARTSRPAGAFLRIMNTVAAITAIGAIPRKAGSQNMYGRPPPNDSFVCEDVKLEAHIAASDDYGLKTIRIHRALNEVYSQPKTISFDQIVRSFDVVRERARPAHFTEHDDRLFLERERHVEDDGRPDGNLVMRRDEHAAFGHVHRQSR